MEERPIVVVGSINVDLVVGVERFPGVGETLAGTHFATHPGGKGANQAAAVGRLGYPVQILGRIGSDGFGEQVRQSLIEAGIDTAPMAIAEGASGTAIITVTSGGENNIIIIPGANARLSPADLDANVALIRQAALVLTQLEIPLATVEHLAALCERENVPLILDPAPAQHLGRQTLARVSWITPNDTEAGQMAGSTEPPQAEAEFRELAEQLMELGPRNVLLKLGDRGAFMATADGERLFLPAYSVNSVDTTAAGDAFNGAFAVALARGARAADAARFATAAAAISVTRHGALPSMPTQSEVESFLKDITPGRRSLPDEPVAATARA